MPERSYLQLPITAMGCRQCLPLSVVLQKGKHCRKLHCRNGVVDTLGQSNLRFFRQLRSLQFQNKKKSRVTLKLNIKAAQHLSTKMSLMH